MRRIFSTVRAPHEPAFTVESLAMTATGRPCTRPMPVTTPSAGRSPAWLLARRPSSTKSAPSSKRRRSRSRTKSLPSSAFFLWYFSAPPRCAFSVAAASFDKSDILFSLVLRGSLLGEGAQALEPVLGSERAFVALALDGQALVERDVEAAVDGLLGLGDGERRGADDLLGETGDGLGEPAGRDHLGDEADLLGTGGVDAAAEEDHLLGAGGADGAGQPLG